MRLSPFKWPCDPGSFGKGVDDRWYAVSPNGLLCGLNNHQITEHEDGTITASPSIIVRGGDGDKTYHGFLERGVWREA